MNQENNEFNQNNDYMNSNYNQNNGFEQNYNQNPNMNYQSVEPVQGKEPKKNNNLLVIILLLLVIGLAGFIVYDKVIKKEEPKEPEKPVENNELVAFNENQFSERDNVTEDGKEYFKVLTYKNNKLMVDFKLYYEREEHQDYNDIQILANMYVNNLKVKDIKFRSYTECTPDDDFYNDCVNNMEPNGYFTLDNAKKEAIDYIKHGIGTIKGDKYYLYFAYDIYYQGIGNILFANENGVIGEITYLANELNPNYDNKINYTCKREYTASYSYYEVEEAALYYLKYSKYEKNQDSDLNKEYANEYKVTIINDKMLNEKINTCEVSSVNRPDDSVYEDM